MATSYPCSPALLAANRRLLELRAARGVACPEASGDREAAGAAQPVLAQTRARPGGGHCGEAALAASLGHPVSARLPAHLGWDSPAVTRALRGRAGDGEHSTSSRQQITVNSGQRTAPGDAAPPQTIDDRQSTIDNPASAWVKLYPDIGLGMLRAEQAAAGRVWLLCRALDPAGQGMLRIDTVKQQLAHASSPLRICGWRQLRNLLRQGDGVFWQRDGQRLWLRSAARVAQGLGVPRLSGWPVALPLAALLGTIGAVRAQLYAAFHSGRMKERATQSGSPAGAEAAPIARETLAALSGAAASSQRAYEARARVRVQANFAVGEQALGSGGAGQQERAWRQGGALFQLHDGRGLQGRRGGTYLAWQLPNSYVGRHARRPKGRQRRINRALNDLVKKGTPGNGEEAVETARQVRGRRYFAHGKDAARGARRTAVREVYWRRRGGATGRRAEDGRCALWQVMVV